MLTDDRFPKDRVFISGSYNNEYARVVARAISLNRVIFVRHKHLYQKFVTIKEENIQYPVEVRPGDLSSSSFRSPCRTIPAGICSE